MGSLLFAYLPLPYPTTIISVFLILSARVHEDEPHVRIHLNRSEFLSHAYNCQQLLLNIQILDTQQFLMRMIFAGLYHKRDKPIKG